MMPVERACVASSVALRHEKEIVSGACTQTRRKCPLIFPFGDKSFIKEGLVLYYLDAFPCYGEADSVRVWVSPNGKMVGNLRIVCIGKPEKISFAWRNATEDANQARTTGILTCPVDGNRNFTIDISKCERGPNWTEYK